MKKSNIYKKLLPSGNIDTNSIKQADFDVLLTYIKNSFPKATKMQRDLDQTLKRTFVLCGNTTQNKSFRLCRRPSNLNKTKKKTSRRATAIPVPKLLPYNRFSNLNNIWNEYVRSLLSGFESTNTDEIQQILNRIDFHGASIKVAYSNCKDFVNISGIVIKETRNTFVLVCHDNHTRTIPKSEGGFQISLESPAGFILIAGNSILTRPAERASKKVKSFMEFMGSRAYKSTLRYTNHLIKGQKITSN